MQKKNFRNNHRSFRYAGVALLLGALFLLVLIYYPVAWEEIKFGLANTDEKVIVRPSEHPAKGDESKIIMVKDENFGIVIPKILVNAKVIADVDPNDEAQYQPALAKGVAHARDTAKPGEDGNIFIFAHSGTNLLEAMRFNAVFYLLSKLEAGDEIIIFFEGEKIEYSVSETKTVPAEDIRYLESKSTRKTLTLMTCWPPGTTWKRLIVVAEQKK